MRNAIGVVCLLLCGGCQVQRVTEPYRVVDASDYRPIPGATVWIQPWAPIHPFWPAGSSGVTDTDGYVWLSGPDGFWFYFSSVKAAGYSEVACNDRLNPPPDKSWRRFYMMRNCP